MKYFLQVDSADPTKGQYYVDISDGSVRGEVLSTGAEQTIPHTLTGKPFATITPDTRGVLGAVWSDETNIYFTVSPAGINVRWIAKL
jgi:hypothetical protein